jgi:fructose-1,6-bisphosphatase/inositol monophosphatase family enzyme
MHIFWMLLIILKALILKFSYQNMDQNLSQFIHSTLREVFEFMRPSLSNYKNFAVALGKQLQIKEFENYQYSFDVELDKIIKSKIEQFGITGKIFSEESGFYEFGDKKYRVVFDPFCNSSLASRTFHEAAVGISIFNYNYEFITSAIMDYQTGIAGIVENGVTKFYQIQSGEEIGIEKVLNKNIDESWVVVTLENKEERKNIAKATKLLNDAKRIIISSGHIYWLKLATGNIDAYIDPFGGERLYEMFACTVAQHSGCLVTDLSGEDFDPAKYLKIFENDPNYVYYPVATTNADLHKQVLASIDR